MLAETGKKLKKLRKPMKPLTERQARRCETAKNSRCRCRCRCKGMLHGGQRAMFELLPEGDPHHFRTDRDLVDALRKERKHFQKLVGQGKVW